MTKSFGDLVPTKWHPSKVWSWKIKVFPKGHVNTMVGLLTRNPPKNSWNICFIFDKNIPPIPPPPPPPPKKNTQGTKLKNKCFSWPLWKGRTNDKVKITDWMHIYGISAVCRSHYLKKMAKRFWDLVPTKWHPSKVLSWKIKVFCDIVERSKKNVTGQYNRLDAYLRHLSCL